MELKKEFSLNVFIKNPDEKLTDCYSERYKIYCLEKKWLNPLDFPFEMEMDEYDKISKHIVIYDNSGRLKGYTRLIVSKDFKNLPVSKFPGIELENNPLYKGEVSRFISTDKKMGRMISMFLVRTMFNKCLDYRMRYSYFIVELSFVRYLKMMGFACEAITEPTEYFGDITVPVKIDLRASYYKFKKMNNAYGDWFISRKPVINQDDYIYDYLGYNKVYGKELVNV